MTFPTTLPSLDQLESALASTSQRTEPDAGDQASVQVGPPDQSALLSLFERALSGSCMAGSSLSASDLEHVVGSGTLLQPTHTSTYGLEPGSRGDRGPCVP